MFNISPTDFLLSFTRFASYPAGRQLFTKILFRSVPYSGTLPALVNRLDDQGSEVLLYDKKKAHNHLKSLHALALANAGELSTGLALGFWLKKRGRYILIKLETEYYKKARGTIAVRCSTQAIEPPMGAKKFECPLMAEAIDSSGACVSRTKATWLVEFT